MGVNLKDIVPHEPLEFGQLKGRTIAVDALNTLYQFLASIRQPDGTPLMNSSGEVTSHLTGLLYRTSNLLRLGIKPVFVFDGKPHKLKHHELERRAEFKKESQEEWQKARDEGRIEDALKHAKRTSRMTDEMLADSKTLLDYMGVPFIQAPSEGEAQCAYMCLKGEAWAVGSQDYDALLFGAPRVVKGLTLSGKMELSMIELDKTLSSLGVTREQLVDVAILVGTDFNEGVHGIGPKKGLKAVKEDKMGEFQMEVDLNEVRSIFLKPETTDVYEVKWGVADENGLVEFLCKRHDFSQARVVNAARELVESQKAFTQQSLSKWF
ncbi:MAG: flap endonuclease-1 [Candidatus Altiarchaeales archaeon]|nr:flap endonuclease-1 [Candidatus Altiarchaeales archaeon]